MPRSRWVYRGGQVVAEYQGDTLVWADGYEPEASEAAPMIVPDLPGYQSPVTGLWVEGRVARREDLKRTGSRPWEGREQEAKEIARKRSYAAQAEEQRIERNTWETYNHLPRAVQRILNGEA